MEGMVGCVSCQVSGHAGLTPDHSTSELELVHRVASKSAVRSVVGGPVTEGTDACGSSKVRWWTGLVAGV